MTLSAVSGGLDPQQVFMRSAAQLAEVMKNFAGSLQTVG